ncbi:unnamed protein product [Ceutorhynchus assimilis]|uniref:Uncharacterized protein n=1 Tax=Ceutorhynchus assimilis TaxID=467358 RepID=A0A9N9QKK8_9CUCU|nr:unnamed protein product [Ceutorhynchus assimilis]
MDDLSPFPLSQQSSSMLLGPNVPNIPVKEILLRFMDQLDNCLVKIYRLNVAPSWGEIKELQVSLKYLRGVVVPWDLYKLYMKSILDYIDIVMQFIAGYYNYLDFQKQMHHTSALLSSVSALFREETCCGIFLQRAATKIFDLVLIDDQPIILKIQLLCMLNDIIIIANLDVRMKTGNQKIEYLYRLFDWLSTLGEYLAQITVMKLITNIFAENIKGLKYCPVPGREELGRELININRSNIHSEARIWLNKFNENSNLICSFAYETIHVGNINCECPNEGDFKYIDFNIKEKLVSFYTKISEDNWNRVFIIVNRVDTVEIQRSNSFIILTIVQTNNAYVSQNISLQAQWNNVDPPMEILLINTGIMDKLKLILGQIFGDKFLYSHESVEALERRSMAVEDSISEEEDNNIDMARDHPPMSLHGSHKSMEALERGSRAVEDSLSNTILDQEDKDINMTHDYPVSAHGFHEPMEALGKLSSAVLEHGSDESIDALERFSRAVEDCPSDTIPNEADDDFNKASDTEPASAKLSTTEIPDWAESAELAGVGLQKSSRAANDNPLLANEIPYGAGDVSYVSMSDLGTLQSKLATSASARSSIKLSSDDTEGSSNELDENQTVLSQVPEVQQYRLPSPKISGSQNNIRPLCDIVERNFVPAEYSTPVKKSWMVYLDSSSEDDFKTRAKKDQAKPKTKFAPIKKRNRVRQLVNRERGLHKPMPDNKPLSYKCSRGFEDEGEMSIEQVELHSDTTNQSDQEANKPQKPVDFNQIVLDENTPTVKVDETEILGREGVLHKSILEKKPLSYNGSSGLEDEKENAKISIVQVEVHSSTTNQSDQAAKSFMDQHQKRKDSDHIVLEENAPTINTDQTENNTERKLYDSTNILEETMEGNHKYKKSESASISKRSRARQSVRRERVLHKPMQKKKPLSNKSSSGLKNERDKAKISILEVEVHSDTRNQSAQNHIVMEENVQTVNIIETEKPNRERVLQKPLPEKKPFSYNGSSGPEDERDKAKISITQVEVHSDTTDRSNLNLIVMEENVQTVHINETKKLSRERVVSDKPILEKKPLSYEGRSGLEHEKDEISIEPVEVHVHTNIANESDREAKGSIDEHQKSEASNHIALDEKAPMINVNKTENNKYLPDLKAKESQSAPDHSSLRKTKRRKLYDPADFSNLDEMVEGNQKYKKPKSAPMRKRSRVRQLRSRDIVLDRPVLEKKPLSYNNISGFEHKKGKDEVSIDQVEVHINTSNQSDQNHIILKENVRTVNVNETEKVSRERVLHTPILEKKPLSNKDSSGSDHDEKDKDEIFIEPPKVHTNSESKSDREAKGSIDEHQKGEDSNNIVSEENAPTITVDKTEKYKYLPDLKAKESQLAPDHSRLRETKRKKLHDPADFSYLDEMVEGNQKYKKPKSAPMRKRSRVRQLRSRDIVFDKPMLEKNISGFEHKKGKDEVSIDQVEVNINTLNQSDQNRIILKENVQAVNVNETEKLSRERVLHKPILEKKSLSNKDSSGSDHDKDKDEISIEPVEVHTNIENKSDREAKGSIDERQKREDSNHIVLEENALMMNVDKTVNNKYFPDLKAKESQPASDPSSLRKTNRRKLNGPADFSYLDEMVEGNRKYKKPKSASITKRSRVRDIISNKPVIEKKPLSYKDSSDSDHEEDKDEISIEPAKVHTNFANQSDQEAKGSIDEHQKREDSNHIVLEENALTINMDKIENNKYLSDIKAKESQSARDHASLRKTNRRKLYDPTDFSYLDEMMEEVNRDFKSKRSERRQSAKKRKGFDVSPNIIGLRKRVFDELSPIRSLANTTRRHTRHRHRGFDINRTIITEGITFFEGVGDSFNFNLFEEVSPVKRQRRSYEKSLRSASKKTPTPKKKRQSKIKEINTQSVKHESWDHIVKPVDIDVESENNRNGTLHDAPEEIYAKTKQKRINIQQNVLLVPAKRPAMENAENQLVKDTKVTNEEKKYVTFSFQQDELTEFIEGIEGAKICCNKIEAFLTKLYKKKLL